MRSSRFLIATVLVIASTITSAVPATDKDAFETISQERKLATCKHYFYETDIEMTSVDGLSCSSAQLNAIGAYLNSAYDQVVKTDVALSALTLSTTVCTSATSFRRTRGLLGDVRGNDDSHRELVLAASYLWKGGGKCRLCKPDNSDRLLREDQGEHEEQRELRDMYAVLDFNKDYNGNPIIQLYVRDEWIAQYGVTITVEQANGGYAPSKKARIFDTSRVSRTGDNDLGSPNIKCPAINGVQGTGNGKYGEPGQPGENCVPQGNVLIIQQKNIAEGDYNDNGGVIQFAFRSATRVGHVGLMDMDNGKSYLEVTKRSGKTYRINYTGLGDNSVQLIPVDDVVKTIKLVMTTGGGAVTEIGIFTPTKAEEALSPEARSYIRKKQPFTEYIPYLEFDLGYYLTRDVNEHFGRDQSSCLYGKWANIDVHIVAVPKQPSPAC
jgi:hypothetical protein